MEWVKHRAFEYEAEKSYGPHDSKKKELHAFLRSDGFTWYQQATQTCDSGCGCREMAKPETIWDAMKNHLEDEFKRSPITEQEFDEHFEEKMEEMKGVELHSMEATGTKIGDDKEGWGIDIRNLRKAQGELWYGQYIPLCKAGKLAYEWLLKYAQCPRYSGIAGFSAKLDESGDVPDNVCRIVSTFPERPGRIDVQMTLEPRWRLSR